MAGRGTCCGAAQAEQGALGGAAPAKAGAGGEDALMESQGWKQLHIMPALAEDQGRHSGGASEDWGRRGGTGGGPAPTDIEGPAGGVMSRLRCGRSSDSDGRDLRLVQTTPNFRVQRSWLQWMVVIHVQSGTSGLLH